MNLCGGKLGVFVSDVFIKNPFFFCNGDLNLNFKQNQNSDIFPSKMSLHFQHPFSPLFSLLCIFHTTVQDDGNT